MKLFKKSLLLIAAICLIFIVLSLSPYSIIHTPKSTAKDFLRTLHVDRSAAYEMTSPEFKQKTTQEDFEAFVNLYPHLTIIKRGDFEIVSEEENFVVLRGTVYFFDEQNAPMEISVIKGEKGWEVAGFNLI